MGLLTSREERKIKNDIKLRAEAFAKDIYEKELVFRALSASDFSYSILSDLVKAAHLTGLVTIHLKDGTKIEVVDTRVNESERQTLAALDGRLY